jgi:hypothetical protein
MSGAALLRKEVLRVRRRVRLLSRERFEDPRSGEIIYVGKGKDDRMYRHWGRHFVVWGLRVRLML